MDVVGQHGLEPRRPAAGDDIRGQLVVPGIVIGDAVDDLGRLLRGQHPSMARRPVHHGRKRRNQVAGIDDHDVEAGPGDLPPLHHQSVANRAEDFRGDLALERRFDRAVARRVNGQVSAGQGTHHGIQAMQSISTFTPLRGADASTVVRAGWTPLKYSLKTRLNTGKSSMLRKNTPTLTT